MRVVIFLIMLSFTGAAVNAEELNSVSGIESLGIWQFETKVGDYTLKETWVLRANSKYIRFFQGIGEKETALDEETGTYAVLRDGRILFIFDSDVGGRMQFYLKKSDKKYFVSRDRKTWIDAKRPLIGSLTE